MSHELVCSVDLGSNSFRLLVGRVIGSQIYALDGLKEPVRLASGLNDEKMLDAESCARGLEALKKFNERIRSFAPDAVRAVATNTFRIAKNAKQFLHYAEEALGFPIEVVSGREEARLIYVGVAHTLADSSQRNFVVDIGGGSTEFIIGQHFDSMHLESLYMGCVGYTRRFFSNGCIDKASLKEAEWAARHELQAIVHTYRAAGWDRAIASSGSAKALSEVMHANNWSSGDITREGLEAVREHLLQVGRFDALELPGLKTDRIPVFAGGFAILSAVFKEFQLDSMEFSDGGLRLGVLYDLLGRYHHQDLRNATVAAFTERYQVDVKQADYVADAANTFFCQLAAVGIEFAQDDARFLQWAALLHEIGLSIAHASYHKHSAYIVGNADMPGFSRMDQTRLAYLVLAHRGKLERVQASVEQDTDWYLICVLRLAVIIYRSREERSLDGVRLQSTESGFTLKVKEDWLQRYPLTATALEDEQQQWAKLGWVFELVREGW